MGWGGWGWTGQDRMGQVGTGLEHRDRRTHTPAAALNTLSGARSPWCQPFIPSQPEMVPAAGLLPWRGTAAQEPAQHPSAPPAQAVSRRDTNTSSAPGLQLPQLGSLLHGMGPCCSFGQSCLSVPPWNKQPDFAFFLTSTAMEKFLKYQKYNPRHFSCPMKQQKSSLKKCILIYLLSLLVFLVSCGRTQEFFACNKLGIFCYFSVLIQWDFSTLPQYPLIFSCSVFALMMP